MWEEIRAARVIRGLFQAGLALVLVLSGPAAEKQFRIAEPGYRFEFPRDHFSHPDFKTEWWYYTGNLSTADGRRWFGFELTFFREGVASAGASRSAWAIENLYLAHFALTDVKNDRFRYGQRMHRGALGIAGALDVRQASARRTEARVWIGDWHVSIAPGGHRLRAAEKDFAIELDLRPLKPPVIHGRAGVSRKGPGPGDASHYYSFSRLEASGRVRSNGEQLDVGGLAWMDHEFSTSALAPGQVGWDWFALQFEDGSELMLGQLRRRDGSRDPYSFGAYIPASGPPRVLGANDYKLIPNPESLWRSVRSHARYPLQWRVQAPPLELDVEVAAVVSAQELVTAETTGVAYWEGAVRGVGQKMGARVLARGYLEMTGYAPDGRLSGLRQLGN